MRPLICILLLCIPTIIGAQSARQLLDEMRNAIQPQQGYVITFTTKIKEIKKKVTHQSQGTIELQGERFHLKSNESEMWFDGTQLWSHLNGSTETTLSKPDEEELLLTNPTQLLSLYKKGMTLAKLTDSNDAQGRRCYQIELKPQKKSDLERIVILMEKSTKHPAAIHITQRGAIEMEILLTGITAKTLSPALFTYTPNQFPNVELIDLR